MNSSAQVEGLAFVECILPLCWEQRQSIWTQMLVGGSHLVALFFFFFWERGNKAKAESDVEGGGSRVLAKREEVV